MIPLPFICHFYLRHTSSPNDPLGSKVLAVPPLAGQKIKIGSTRYVVMEVRWTFHMDETSPVDSVPHAEVLMDCGSW